MSKHWCESTKVKDALVKFHDRHASFPKAELDKAKTELGALLTLFRAALVKEFEGIQFEDKEFKCAGSAHYEKAHIARWDRLLELDMELVMLVENIFVSTMPDQSCAKELNDAKPSAPSWLRKCGFFDDKGRLSAELVLQKFLNVLKTVPVGDHITFSKSGPAAKMEVCDGPERWFNVDLVPVIYIPGVGSYVPKQKACGKKVPHAWRESFTTEESQYFKDEKKWHHARMCLRIMKALASLHYALSHLKSYAIKNVFIMELKKNPSPDQWTEKTMGRRVMDLLISLRDCLKAHNITPVEGQGSCINLLRTQKKQAVQVMHDYVYKICDNQKAFTEAFSVTV